MKLQARKSKFKKISTDLLAEYVSINGSVPKSASGWALAARYCCQAKDPSTKLCNAVRNHWHRDINGVQEKVTKVNLPAIFINIKILICVHCVMY